MSLILSSDYTNSFNQDISNNSDQEARRINHLVVGIAGILLTPVLLIITILFIFVYKAYKTTFQRLILYHILLVLLCELTFALQIELNFHVGPPERRICVSLNYLYLYLPIAWYVYTTAVTNCSFLLAVRLLRGRPNIWQGGKLAECICIVVTITLPMAYLWKPILDGSSVTLTCDKLESSKWYEDTMILSTVILILCIEVVFVCVALGCMFCSLRQRLRSSRLTTLLKHLLYHSGINATVMVLDTLVMAYCSYRYFVHPSKQLSHALYLIVSLEEPLFFFISVLFQSFISIWHQNNSSRSCSISCCLYCIRTYGDQYTVNADENKDQTNPPSHPLNQPSYTYFSVPYTGAFTQVTSDKHHQSVGEHTPLMINKNGT